MRGSQSRKCSLSRRLLHLKRCNSLPLPCVLSAAGSSDNTPRSRHNNTKKKKHTTLSVSFSREGDGSDGHNLSVSVVEFANEEFCSLDPKVRQQVWYSSLEIRAIKQANMDDVIRQQQQKEEDEHGKTGYDHGCWRGLEHLIEGETERRRRIHEFVVSVCQCQHEYLKRKRGCTTATGQDSARRIADALGQFCRSQSKPDRRRAAKMGILDAAEVERNQPELSASNTPIKYSAFDPPRNIIPRTRSSSFHKRRTLMRNLSFRRASWMSGSMIPGASGGNKSTSSRSLQSTSSMGSANSNCSFWNP